MSRIGISETGLFHKRDGLVNEDHIMTGSTDRYRVIVLADGVSTCRCSGIGARIACEKTKDYLLGNAKDVFSYEEVTIAEYVLGLVNRAICETAESDGNDICDYSSTLSAVLYDSETCKAIVFHLGDGLILLVNDNGCKVIGMPYDHSVGTPVTTTEGVCKMSIVRKIDTSDSSYILMFSDGAWDLIYTKGSLMKEVMNFIINGEFDKLNDYLRNRVPEDDYSYIGMSLR